jgi:hypothetical protein
MRARVMWWALAVGVAVLVAPGALTAVERVGGGPVAGAEQVRAVPPEAGVGTRPSRAGGPTTTTALPVVATTVAPSGAAGTTAGGGGGGRCAPSCSAPTTVPSPPITYDPFAGCPHRWQVDPATGQRIDTGCASEPVPPVSVIIVTTTAPPPVILPPPPTTTTTAPPPPTTPPITAATGAP